MRTLFYNCSKLKSIDLSNFNTSKVKTMEAMFTHDINLEKIYLAEIRIFIDSIIPFF